MDGHGLCTDSESTIANQFDSGSLSIRFKRLMGFASSLQYSIDAQMFDSFVACQIYVLNGLYDGAHTPSAYWRSTRQWVLHTT